MGIGFQLHRIPGAMSKYRINFFYFRNSLPTLLVMSIVSTEYTMSSNLLSSYLYCIVIGLCIVPPALAK